MIEKMTAVITGGSSGIGEATAKALIANGYQVINADITAEPSSTVDHVPCDITSAKDIDKLYGHVKEKYGIPDVLVSNAGQGIHEKLAEGDPDKWQKTIDINLMGTLRFIRAFLPEMLGRKRGDIVFMSSISGRQPYEYGGIYSATKAAINMISDTLRLETQGLLRIINIAPGVVDTKFFKNMVSSNHTIDDIGLGSLSPEQVAEMVIRILKLPESVNIPDITITPTKQV